MRNLFSRVLEQAGGDGAAGGGERRPSPAELNAARNQERLNRINHIGQTADGRRAADMSDVDGERVTGRFAGGELDDSDGARLRQAEIDADASEQARLEQTERERQAQDLEDQEEARRLQEEGGESRGTGGEGDDSQGNRDGNSRGAEEGDERVIDGMRYYRTMVAGTEKWFTLKELRAGVANGLATEDTLRRAQEALASASQSPLTPKAGEDEGLSAEDLENVILSASMGDEEAVRKLASELRRRPKGTDPKDVSRLVAQQIATQREVDRAETAQADLLGNDTLAPIFRMRLTAFAQDKPSTKIGDAYKTVGEQMRKDFAPMLSRAAPRGNPGSSAHLSKQDRKRTIVTPPQSAGRQPPREDADREVPLGEQIDAIARSRGQQRAYRIRRS